jgi:hypothetical protein
MKKYIIGFVLGAVLFSGGIVFAKDLSEKLSFRIFDTEYYKVKGWDSLSISKFVDPDNGNLCYVSKQGYSGGISCLKNN